MTQISSMDQFYFPMDLLFQLSAAGDKKEYFRGCFIAHVAIIPLIGRHQPEFVVLIGKQLVVSQILFLVTNKVQIWVGFETAGVYLPVQTLWLPYNCLYKLVFGFLRAPNTSSLR